MELLARILAVGMILANGVALAQTDAETEEAAAAEAPDFDVVAFMERAEVARWLLRYDRVAWETTDLVMTEPPEVLERLSPIWFCLEHKGKWHALYGSFDTGEDRYVAVLHYVETRKEYKRVKKGLPAAEVDDLARALHTAGERIDELLSGKGAKFNTYVRPLDSGEIEVWALPAWQQDGQLAFGVSYRAVLDGEGRRIIEEEPPTGTLRKAIPSSDQDLIIPNEDADLPSVGQIFTTLLVVENVAFAGVQSRDYLSLYVDLSQTGDYRWVHVHRDYDVKEAIEGMRRLYSEGRLEPDEHDGE